MKNFSEIMDSAKKTAEETGKKLRYFLKHQLVTMKSVEQLDDNIYLLDYKNDYHLPELLERGVSSLGELTAFASDALTLGLRLCKIGGDEGAGCSTFDAFTPDGHHLLARNFDFKTSPCFVVWTHPKCGYAGISVVNTNFIVYGSSLRYNKLNSYRVLVAPYCCVDGMNEKGLAIAVLQMKAKATNQTDSGKKDITTTAMIRAVLDNCADVDEAVELIKRYNMHDSIWTNYHYQIVDASGRSVTVEYIDNVFHVYERGNPEYSTDSSVYEDDGMKFQYVSNYSLTKDVGSFQIEGHGEDRMCAVKKVLTEKDGIMTELEAMDLLSHVRLKYKHPKYPWNVVALWSAVYNTKEKTLKLAANLDYKKIYTFRIDRPGLVLNRESLEDSEYPETIWSY
ncbi:MAG: linear amide C-N hydrolase [Clostridiales bacterium]|nr:linear amide C-N hydrolase [Clostridiales bacterium]